MKKSLPSSVLNKPEKVSDPFSSLIIAHFLWMCSIFLKFCLYFSTKFPAKNYAKKRFLFFFVIFGNSVNFGIVLTMIFLMKSNNVHKAYFSCGKTPSCTMVFCKKKTGIYPMNMPVLVLSLFKFVQQTGKNAGTILIRTIIGHEFDISARTNGYAADCIFCHHGMDAGSALDQLIQTIE